MSSEPLNQSKTVVEHEPKKGEKLGPFPTFVDLAAIFGVFIVAQLVAVMLVKFSLPLLITPTSDAILESLTMLIAQIISMSLVIVFILFLRRRRSAESTPIHLSLNGFNPAILLGGVLMLLSMGVVIEPLIALLPPSPALTQRGWPMMLAVVFCAPIFEEIICRGMIFESIRAKRGVVVAWLSSSLFFGLMHLDPAMVVNAFFMGLILCYIYIRSRSLIASIILHSINNAIAYSLIIMGFAGDQGSILLRDLITNQSVYWVVYGAAVIILITSTLLCMRQFKAIIKSSQAVAPVEQMPEEEIKE